VDLLQIKYPIYIISKGRWERSQTANVFLSSGIPFKIAVEPQEYDLYCKEIGKNYIEKLPFSNLGLGSFPARNWCWEQSIKEGHKSHFLFDDNIQGFSIFHKGKRDKVHPYKPLLMLSKLHDSYSNLAITGYNYDMFITKSTKKAFNINVHVYSGMLIRNDIPYRWRLKYNEDVDLCLQALHDKWCTALLNAYTIRKTSTTAKMKGGNQTELYKNNSFQKKVLKVKSLERMWPQYVKTVQRFGRPHHQVSWKKFFSHPLLKKI
jgi:hypothetical protein